MTINLVSVHAPIESKSLLQKDKFYDFQNVINEFNTSEITIIMEDLNDRVDNNSMQEVNE